MVLISSSDFGGKKEINIFSKMSNCSSGPLCVFGLQVEERWQVTSGNIDLIKPALTCMTCVSFLSALTAGYRN